MNSELLAFVADSENPAVNYRMGLWYLEKEQTAAAVSFFLRCAERTQDVNLQYECLIRMGHCFDKQGRREGHTMIMYRRAQILLPNRPEAYFFLARIHERKGRWSECYATAELGLHHTSWETTPENQDIEYPGAYGLLFEKAVSAWWVNQEHQSRSLFIHLSEKYHDSLDAIHRQAIYNNIFTLGIGPESVTHRYYNRNLYGKFRSNFSGLQDIEKNFSQCYQDIFVLAALDGKRNGRYLEIGSAGPFYGNNTALLEKQFGWKGVGVELNEDLVKKYEEERSNVVICADAVKLDYNAVLSVLARDGVIDYLQLDIDPSDVTYAALLKIPFDKYKFAVITYEHDHYCDITKTYRDLSREFLKSKGYELVVGDISPDGMYSFEDWWIHPELVSYTTLEKLRFKNTGSISAHSYMFPEHPVIPDFEWGDIAKNEWFHSLVHREVFVDKVY
ncbi:MAG: class I SAM-dependent methyltransferase, partial [Micrococcales bacterium]|nr:class I SAM-dependent methyltransferase [Micrococcales bacterium]